MPRGEWTSPWQYSAADYLGRTVTVSVFFNVTTLAIIDPGLTGNRDSGCLYDRLVVGGQKVANIPEGGFSVTRQALSIAGLSLITDITDSGFTLGTTE